MVAPLKERTVPLVEETKLLLEKRMARSKKSEAESADAAVSDSNSCGPGDPNDEERRDNERLDQIEEELKEIVEEYRQIELAYSYSNLWIKRFERMEIKEHPKSKFFRLYVDNIRICGLEQWEGYTVKIVMPNNDFRSLLPEEWLPDHTYALADAVGKPDSVRKMEAAKASGTEKLYGSDKGDFKGTPSFRREGGK